MALSDQETAELKEKAAVRKRLGLGSSEPLNESLYMQPQEWKDRKPSLEPDLTNATEQQLKVEATRKEIARMEGLLAHLDDSQAARSFMRRPPNS